MLSQFLFDSIRIGIWLVDLIDGYNDGHLGGARVFDGFNGLGHNAIISRDHQHDYIRGFGAPRAHQGESLVTWRVEKDYPARLARSIRTRHLHTVGADVLSNTSGLSAGHISGANAVK